MKIDKEFIGFCDVIINDAIWQSYSVAKEKYNNKTDYYNQERYDYFINKISERLKI